MFYHFNHSPGTPRPTIYKWLAINWMIPNLYTGNGCFTKHPFKTGCLGYQAFLAVNGGTKEMFKN